MSATRRTVCSTSVRAASSRSGSRPASNRSISASTTEVAIERSATTVGVDVGRAARGEEGRHLLGDDPAHLVDLAAGIGGLELLGQVDQVEAVHAVQLDDVGVDVVG